MAWKRSERFHQLSGTQTNLDKTICFVTTACLEASMDFAKEQNPPLQFKNSFILVGGLIVVREILVSCTVMCESRKEYAE